MEIGSLTGGSRVCGRVQVPLRQNSLLKRDCEGLHSKKKKTAHDTQLPSSMAAFNVPSRTIQSRFPQQPLLFSPEPLSLFAGGLQASARCCAAT